MPYPFELESNKYYLLWYNKHKISVTMITGWLGFLRVQWLAYICLILDGYTNINQSGVTITSQLCHNLCVMRKPVISYFETEGLKIRHSARKDKSTVHTTWKTDGGASNASDIPGPYLPIDNQCVLWVTLACVENTAKVFRRWQVDFSSDLSSVFREEIVGFYLHPDAKEARRRVVYCLRLDESK